MIDRITGFIGRRKTQRAEYDTEEWLLCIHATLEAEMAVLERKLDGLDKALKAVRSRRAPVPPQREWDGHGQPERSRRSA